MNDSDWCKLYWKISSLLIDKRLSDNVTELNHFNIDYYDKQNEKLLPEEYHYSRIKYFGDNNKETVEKLLTYYTVKCF